MKSSLKHAMRRLRRELKFDKQDLSPADVLLIKKTVENVSWRYPGGIDDERVDRIEYELNVMINMGFADYFLIVQDFLDFGRRIGHMPDERFQYLKEHYQEMTIEEENAYINADQSAPGMTIGPGRGSAAGSLVAYILGITNLDPIKYGLLFERFLNPERVSMPDIDSDFSKADYDYGVRDIVIDYVKKKYGENGVCGITTPSTLAPRAAVENVARSLGAREIYKAQASRGSAEYEMIKKRYLKYGDEVKKKIPEGADVSFKKMYPVNGTNVPLAEILDEEFKDRPELLEILHFAERAETLNINFGMHACGKIIYPGDIRSSAAMMFDTGSGIWKLQMDAVQAEHLGYLKMDFLGLKNLNLATMSVRYIWKNHGIKIDLEKLDLEDQKVYKVVFQKAWTQYVFQFSSPGMRQMLLQFQPESFNDLVLLVACYRPGPMQYLDGIIRRKHGTFKAEEAGIVQRLPEIQDIVRPTYQAIVYQEQVQQIFRTCAGYSYGQADLVRRAMGKKNIAALMTERQAFIYGDKSRGITGCEANGISADDAAELFKEMEDFAKYAFNKSHAAVYALIAYITAWLKCYYPAEFFAAVLNCADVSEYGIIAEEMRQFDVKLNGPDIEWSGRNFIAKDGQVYFGFSGIKGIGTAMDGFQETCRSIPQFMAETRLKEATVRTLVRVGAFDRKVSNRQAILDSLSEFFAEKEVIKKKEKEIEKCNAMIADLDSGLSLDRKKYKITTKSLPTREKLLLKIEKSKAAIEDAMKVMYEVNIPSENTYQSLQDKLDDEKDLIGIYVSGHPMDIYGKPEDFSAVNIADAASWNIPDNSRIKRKARWDGKKKTYVEPVCCRVAGIVSNFKRRTDRNGNEIAFFSLEDQTGKIRVCCFHEGYESHEDIMSQIHDGSVLVCTADVSLDQKKEETQLILYGGCEMKEAEAKEQDCFVDMPGIDAWNKIRSIIMQYQVAGSGYRVMIRNTDMDGEIEKTPIIVSEGIFHDGRIKAATY